MVSTGATSTSGSGFDPFTYALFLEKELAPAASIWLEKGDVRGFQSVHWSPEGMEASDRAGLLVKAIEQVMPPPDYPARTQLTTALMTLCALHIHTVATRGPSSVEAAYLSLPDWLCELFGEVLEQWDCKGRS